MTTPGHYVLLRVVRVESTHQAPICGSHPLNSAAAPGIKATPGLHKILVTSTGPADRAIVRHEGLYTPSARQVDDIDCHSQADLSGQTSSDSSIQVPPSAKRSMP